MVSKAEMLTDPVIRRFLNPIRDYAAASRHRAFTRYDAWHFWTAALTQRASKQPKREKAG
jgi:hypothetical protein